MRFINREVTDADSIAQYQMSCLAQQRSGMDWDSREIEDRDGIWITVADVFDLATGKVLATFWSVIQ